MTTGPDKPKKKPTGATRHAATNRAELEAFAEQSRWLIEYHDRRGESLSSRAVALMGFCGVILALLGRGDLPKGASANAWVTVAAALTVGLLVLTAYFCLRTLLPGTASAPGVDELRQRWKDWTRRSGRGKVLGFIADSYLMVDDLDERFPVGDAYVEADRRAKFFKNAALAMLAALTSLVVLLVAIYQQVA